MPSSVVVDGLIVVDKPAGWTSHDVVAKLRGVVGQKKVGHAGTLDPDATGVLLVGLGRVTRLLRFLNPLPKTYTGEVVLGTETDTLDASGEVIAAHSIEGVTLADLRTAAAALTGDIQQVPPMVSAVKVGGRRLHEMARRGEEVEREPRPVTVHRFEVGEPTEPGVHPIAVTCSSGTYVRVLAADLGTLVGAGAHLRSLRRTAIGPFTLAEAHTMEAIEADHRATVISPVEAIPHLPVIEVSSTMTDRVANGARLGLHELGAAGEGPWRVLDPEGRLLAVYEAHKGGAKPAVVLAGDR